MSLPVHLLKDEIPAVSHIIFLRCFNKQGIESTEDQVVLKN